MSAGWGQMRSGRSGKVGRSCGSHLSYDMSPEDYD